MATMQRKSILVESLHVETDAKEKIDVAIYGIVPEDIKLFLRHYFSQFLLKSIVTQSFASFRFCRLRCGDLHFILF